MGNQQNKQANDFFRNMATAASITSSFVQKKSTVVGDPVNAPAPSSSFTIAHSLASWVVDGLTAHAADLLASPDAATELTIRELCNELIDVNVGTQRISTLLLYCCDLLDQVIAVTTPPPPPSANASSSGAASGEGRGGGTGTNDSKGHVNATSSSSGKTNTSLPDALVRSTQVALRLCQTILRHAIRASQGDSILLLKMLDGGSARQSVPSSSMKYLELLVEFVLRVPLGPSTLVLHWEATDSLVVLCSTALYHSPRPASTSSSGSATAMGASSSTSNDNSDALFHADIFTESILTLDVIRPLIAILVQRVVAWGVKLMPETAFQYRIHKGPSFRNMYGLYGANAQDWSSVADLLGRSSAQLLSILAFHVPLFQNEAQVVAAFLTLSGCPPTVESTNGNQQQVGHSSAAADKSDLAGASQRTPPPKPPTQRSTEEEAERPRSVVIEILAQLVSGEHIHFDLLLHAMRDKMLSTPILALLFYAFLWHHPTFLHNALSHETWRMLLLDVAWEVLLLSSASSTLHHTTHHHPPAAAAASPPTDTVVQTFQNLYLQYVSASILSLLSQDKTFHTLSFQTRVREPTTLVAAAAQTLTGKLTETGSAAFLVQSITIGSGAIVLCCRGILRSLPLDASQQSVDLAKLYLSFLRNSSPFVHDIHHFAAQKIVSTLRVLTKRFLKIKSSIEAVYQEGRQRIEEEKGAAIQDAVPYALLAEAETLLTFLVGLFDAVVTMLDGSHPNHSLTYELLYHRAALDLDDPHTTTTKPQTSSNSHSTATAVENLSLVTTATTGSSSFTSLDTTQPKMLVETAHDADFFIGPLLRKLRATKRPILELLRQYDIEMASVAMNHSPDDILKLIIRVSGSTMAHALSSVTHDEDGDHDAMSASTSSSEAYSDLDADSVLGEEAKEIEARRQRALKAEREEKHALYRIRRRRDAVYVYREQPHANALFFTPTVWATIVSESPKVGSPHWVVTPEEIGKLRLFYS